MITQSPTTKVVERGHNALLQCAAVGSPPPVISWVRDMVPINTSNPRYTVLESGKYYRSNVEGPMRGPRPIPNIKTDC